MTPLIKTIKQGHFLSVDTTSIGNEFAVSDSEELFLKNLKIMPKDWYYRTNTVNYTVNSQGYRTQEFDTIDWTNSVVIFGCSTVFGAGVDNQHTIDCFLSSLLERPVINLGVASTSIAYSLHNALILNENYPTPKAVVNLWTEYSRTAYYLPDRVDNKGSWNDDNFVYEWLHHDSNPATHAVFAQMISHQLWKNKTAYYEATFFPSTAELFKCEHLPVLDQARDLIHYGRQTNKAIAEKIANNITKELN
jgi:hypothetical protein